MKIRRPKGTLIIASAAALVILLLSVNLGIIIFSQDYSPKLSILKGYENISPEKAKEMIDSGQIVVLDVRTPAEYESEHIPDAVLLPLQELEETTPDFDKNTNIIVYCGTGVRSAKASITLSGHGFNRVYNLLGGLSAWKEDGFQVIDNNSENCQTCHQNGVGLFSQGYSGINENGKGLGCLLENIADENRVAVLTLVGVPSSYDWRDYGVMTSVKNQGSCGSCVAFGTIGAFEAVIQVKGGPSSDFSEAHLFFCGGGLGCNTGMYISAALDYSLNYGVPDESCFPYQDHDMSCSNTCSDWQVRARKILNWNWVASDRSSIESALVEYGPLVVGFNVYTDFYSYTGGVYHYTWGVLEGGHCVTLVGYNDSQQYWICKNSWGSSWGESGYFKIGYGQCGIESSVAYITVDAVPPPAPSPDDGVPGWGNDSTPTFIWSMPSDTSGIRGYYWKVDSGLDQWTTLTLVTVPAQSEGTHTVYVKAVDGSGNIGSYGSHEFKIDASSPTTPSIISSTHSEGAWENNNDPSLAWNNVGGPSPVTYHYKLGGYEDWKTTSDNHVSYSDIPDGEYTFNVYASDTGGTGGTDTYMIKIDATPDGVPIISSSTHPDESTWYSDNSPSFNWSAPSSTSPITGYSYLLDQNSGTMPDTTSEGSGTSKSYTNEADAVWWFHIRAEDSATNWGATDHYKAQIDTTVPSSPSLVSPENDVWDNQATQSLSWGSAADATSGVDNYKVFVDGAENQVVENTVTQINVTFPEGTHTWHVVAVDYASNENSSETRTINIDITAPTAPTLTSPENNMWDNVVTQTLDWDSSTDATSGINNYKVFVDGTENQIITDNTVTQVDVTFTEGTHTWRVVAVDHVGNENSSETRTINIDITAPGAFELLAPANNSWENDNTPELSWNASSDSHSIENYELWVDGSLDKMITDNTQTSENASELVEGSHTWRVVAVDHAGNETQSTSTWTINIDITAPTAPTLLEPIDGTKTVDNTPTFRWTAVTDNSMLVAYDIEIDNDPDFSLPENSKVGLTDNFYTPSALPDENYSWRVRTRDNAGNIGNWSSVWTLLIDTRPPAVPTLVWPANGENVNDNTPTLDWNSVPENSLPVFYRVHMSDNSQFPHDNVDSGWISATSYTTAELADNFYYWRVCAKDNAGNIGDNSQRSFRVDTIAPFAPILVSPENNGTKSALSITFTWTENEFSDTYYIQVDNEAGFTSPYIHENSWLTENSYTYVFASNGNYYWRIRARDNAGNVGSWADNFKVTIQAPPTNPTLSSPLYGTKTNDNTLIFMWICGLNTDYHRLLVDNDPDFSSPEENVLLGATDNQYTVELADDNYSWKVIAINPGGENVSATWTLLIDTASPTISEVVATSITQNSATITWTTDELSTSIVEYGTTDNYGSTVSDVVLVTSHSIELTELSAGTTYHFRVKSSDVLGNIEISLDYTFITSSPPTTTTTTTAPPPPPPPPPPPSGKATLTITTTPIAAEVFVDGVSWGVAPQTRSVDPGTYTVSFGAVSGYITPSAQTVTLATGETRTVMGTYAVVPPGKATLTVDTTPLKANVYVDGFLWGTSPQTRLLDAGTYVVSFDDLLGYLTPTSQTITLAENETRTVAGVYTEIPPENIENQSPTYTIPSITPEENTTIQMENTALTEITIQVENAAENVKITVQEVTKGAAGIAIGAPGVTYKYLNIVAENITDAQIGSVVIRFKVEKSWIILNDIDIATITLNRYDPLTGEWTSLPTTYLSEDDTYVYFSAVSPGLSVFGISGLPTTTTTSPPTTTTATTPPPTTTPTTTTAPPTTTTTTTAPPTPIPLALSVSIVGIGVIAVIVTLRLLNLAPFRKPSRKR